MNICTYIKQNIILTCLVYIVLLQLIPARAWFAELVYYFLIKCTLLPFLVINLTFSLILLFRTTVNTIFIYCFIFGICSAVVSSNFVTNNLSGDSCIVKYYGFRTIDYIDTIYDVFRLKL